MPVKPSLDADDLLSMGASNSSETSYAAFTPPTTAASDGLPDYEAASFTGLSDTRTREETVPHPGATYIIRDPATRRLLTIVGGQLRLEHHAGDRGGYHWDCVETKGWLGFRNPAFGVFLGHDGHGRIIASARLHRPWEYFCVRRHKQGGYLLLSRWFDDLWKLDKGSDGRTIVRQAEGGLAWEFERVG
ncbi:hypothetical protein GGS23DRAFT_46961 [Durotheca rogersii]|uniref:uncharacterized protein n=1 Tax=Durotheca rogersii TaxID=419775 RepID=UPI002221162C|nr:uncharacterized protein GGS23DRAFT_46961 [Durotheca rogersii]KAI5862988.1 hypothetical protein GGS23DRAFT_46961 [Durotheca rogersii]